MAKNVPIAPATESSPQTEAYAKQEVVSDLFVDLPPPVAPIVVEQEDEESWYEGFFGSDAEEQRAADIAECVL